MRFDEIIKLCAQSDGDILWAKQGNREVVAYRKSLMFFSEQGLVSAIRDSQSPPPLTESEKLNRFFLLSEKAASAKTKKEAFVSERKLLDSGIDAICLETMDGHRRWINKDLAEPFAFSRKYWILDPPETDEIGNMVFIEEQGKIAGIVMSLRV